MRLARDDKDDITTEVVNYDTIMKVIMEENSAEVVEHETTVEVVEEETSGRKEV